MRTKKFKLDLKKTLGAGELFLFFFALLKYYLNSKELEVIIPQVLESMCGFFFPVVQFFELFFKTHLRVKLTVRSNFGLLFLELCTSS